MPSKYSYAAVLSDYEKRGLTDFTDFRRPRKTTPRAKQPSSRPPPLPQPASQASNVKPAPPPSSLANDRVRLTEIQYGEPPDVFGFERGRGYGLPNSERYRPSGSSQQQYRREEVELSAEDSYDLYNLSQPSTPSFPPAGSYRHGGVTRPAKATELSMSSNRRSHFVKRSASTSSSHQGGRNTGHDKSARAVNSPTAHMNPVSRRASIASSTLDPGSNRQDELFEPARTSSLQSSNVPRAVTSSGKEGAINEPDIFPLAQTRRRRLTNETAIWDPKPSSRPQSAQASQPFIDRKPLAIQQPPTPPLTPKGRNSWDDFSLDSEMDELASLVEKSRIQAIPLHDSHQTPPQSISSGSKANLSEYSSPSVASSRLPSSVSDRPSSFSSPRHGPQTSSAASPPSTHQSSFSSPPRSRPSARRSQTADSVSLLSLSTLSPFDASANHLDLDTDLEPLPPDLCNDPEFAYLPWENPSPAHPQPLPVSRLLRHHSTSSRASSFDSVAPPPIRMNPHNIKPKEGKRADESYMSSTEYLQQQQQEQQQSQQSQPPSEPHLKKAKPSTTFSFLHAVRAGINPSKTIPYDSTKRGRPPVSVKVSRTNAPSIPALFPSYRGPFPPSSSSSSSRKIPKSSGSATMTPTRASIDGGDHDSSTRQPSTTSGNAGRRPTSSSRGGAASSVVSRPATGRSGETGNKRDGGQLSSAGSSSVTVVSGSTMNSGSGSGNEVRRCICGSDGVQPRVVKIAGREFIPCEGTAHERRRSWLVG